MQLSYFTDRFRLKIPVGKDGVFWNGRPDEFNNIGQGLEFSQEFGLTPYAKTGAYGYYDGKPRPHNGHDYAGAPGTALVAPCRVWCSFVGVDPTGYGNFLFLETETVTVNGDTIKLEMVLAHCSEIKTQANRWYEAGAVLALMGSTGMSTGPHTHFGVRPLIVKADGNQFAANDLALRGYVDPSLFMDYPPVYNKFTLLKQRMRLIKKKGTTDIYAVDPKGKANLILNWDSYQNGIRMGLWEDTVDEVTELPELNQIIILAPNN